MLVTLARVAGRIKDNLQTELIVRSRSTVYRRHCFNMQGVLHVHYVCAVPCLDIVTPVLLVEAIVG